MMIKKSKSATLASLVASLIYIKKNIRYEYADRPWAMGILNDANRRILMKTARQVSKSTILSAHSLVNATVRAPFTDLIVTPSMNQTKKFSYDRLGPTIKSSPVINAQFTRDNIENVFEKEMENGSKIYLSYAIDNADRMRGITSDGTKFDEIQDMILGAIEPVVREITFTSKLKLRFWSGTPKSLSNGIQQMWEDSDQREWMVRCRHHSPVYHQRLTPKNLGKTGPVCDVCHRPLNVLDGLWVVTANRGARVHGYHVPQIILPTTTTKLVNGNYGFLDWDEFLYDVEGRGDEDESSILNEKWGESSDSALRPLSRQDVINACVDKRKMPGAWEEWMNGQNLYAGVDWGQGLKSNTTLAIGQFDPRNPKIFRLVYTHKFRGKETNPEYVIPEILRICQLFRVRRIHADWGSGFGMNSRVVELKGEDYLTANYWSSAIKSKRIVYNADMGAFVLNRTHHLSRFFTAIKHKKIVIAHRWENFQDSAKDFLAEFREERRDGTVYYDHKKSEPDDMLHAAIYVWLIASFMRYGMENIETTRAPMG